MSVRNSVALAIRDPAQPGVILLVQRPDDDEDLPGAWGLPAASLRADETWRDAALRTGREKLGVALVLEAELQQGTLQRAGYLLAMRLFSARIADGQPRVPQGAAGVTQYQAWRWGSPDLLEPAAAQGSLCCRLYLRHRAGG